MPPRPRLSFLHHNPLGRSLVLQRQTRYRCSCSAPRDFQQCSSDFRRSPPNNPATLLQKRLAEETPGVTPAIGRRLGLSFARGGTTLRGETEVIGEAKPRRSAAGFVGGLKLVGDISTSTSIEGIAVTSSSSSARKEFTSENTKTQRRFMSSSSKMGFHDTAAFTSVLSSNAEWRDRMTKVNPDLLPQLATGQHPQILWIGCSDSRCPETTILGLQPGDVFVHRNIANIIHFGDINSNAVIEYAVQYLKVKHVVLSGHTQCGGVGAALGNSKVGGVLDVWIAPLRRLRAEHQAELEGLEAGEKSLRLVELNVLEGVEMLKAKDVVIDAVRERGLQVHGVIYDVGSGEIRELDTKDAPGAEEKRVEAFELK